MRQIFQEFWVGILGAAFYLYAMAAQVSGYISAVTGLALFAGATVLLVLGLWPHEPTLAVAVGFIASLVPVWLGRQRLREAWSRFPWRLRVPWEEKQAALPTAAATRPNKATPPRVLSAEQQHFRLDLRMFVMQVVVAHRKLMVVFDRAKQASQPYRQDNNNRQLAAIADIAMGSFQSGLSQLEQMAQFDIEEMNQNELQALTTDFIRTSYANAQGLLNTFCIGLKKGGVAINRTALDVNHELSNWLAADAECLKLLAKLTSSPEVNSLKSAREKYFATVGRRWEVGGW
jgi:hypothetical protein